MCNVTAVNLNTTKHKTALLLLRHSHISYATLCSKLDCKQEIDIDHSTARPRSKAHRRASRVALAVIWQLVALITSTHAQVGIHSTQDDPSDACTRAPENGGSTGAPVAHFPCLSFVPLSTTAAEATSPLPFSLSEPEKSLTLSSSVTVLQSSNSTSTHAVSTSTINITLRGTDQATSTSPPEQIHTVTNGTLSLVNNLNTTISQNSTTDFRSSVQATTFTQDSNSATNATTFPAVL
jgi:hypothetical protein